MYRAVIAISKNRHVSTDFSLSQEVFEPVNEVRGSNMKFFNTRRTPAVGSFLLKKRMNRDLLAKE